MSFSWKDNTLDSVMFGFALVLNGLALLCLSRVIVQDELIKVDMVRVVGGCKGGLWL